MTHDLARARKARRYSLFITIHFIGALAALLLVDFTPMDAGNRLSWSRSVALALPQMFITLAYLLIDRRLCFATQAAFERAKKSPGEPPGPEKAEPLAGETDSEKE
jgi:hypothetical protein